MVKRLPRFLLGFSALILTLGGWMHAAAFAVVCAIWCGLMVPEYGAQRHLPSETKI
jgi:hypothetical protein